MKRIRSDRGQATVLTVIFMVALLGAVAMVLDVGSWFREQRDTQSDADAAALADFLRDRIPALRTAPGGSWPKPVFTTSS